MRMSTKPNVPDFLRLMRSPATPAMEFETIAKVVQLSCGLGRKKTHPLDLGARLVL